ncbi:MAG: hypothetical protein AB1798_23925, partial [Spirochaetota bacterium]
VILLQCPGREFRIGLSTDSDDYRGPFQILLTISPVYHYCAVCAIYVLFQQLLYLLRLYCAFYAFIAA